MERKKIKVIHCRRCMMYTEMESQTYLEYGNCWNCNSSIKGAPLLDAEKELSPPFNLLVNNCVTPSESAPQPSKMKHKEITVIKCYECMSATEVDSQSYRVSRQCWKCKASLSKKPKISGIITSLNPHLIEIESELIEREPGFDPDEFTEAFRHEPPGAHMETSPDLDMYAVNCQHCINVEILSVSTIEYIDDYECGVCHKPLSHVNAKPHHGRTFDGIIKEINKGRTILDYMSSMRQGTPDLHFPFYKDIEFHLHPAVTIPVDDVKEAFRFKLLEKPIITMSTNDESKASSMEFFDAEELIEFSQMFPKGKPEDILKYYRRYEIQRELLTRFLLKNELEKQFEMFLVGNETSLMDHITDTHVKTRFDDMAKYLPRGTVEKWYSHLVDYYISQDKY